jgi:hypothetical protein
MELDDLSLSDAFPTWFWAVGAVLVVGVTVALVAYYVRFPDRSPWQDFAQRRLAVPDDLSGLVPTPSEDGSPPAEG